jgi:hypothetical protein
MDLLGGKFCHILGQSVDFQATSANYIQVLAEQSQHTSRRYQNYKAGVVRFSNMPGFL